MPNYNLIGPINTNITTSLEESSSLGKIYMLTIGIQSLDKDEHLVLYIKNTSSNITLSIGNICASSLIKSSFYIYRDVLFTEDSGTTVTPRNTNSTFSDTIEIKSEYKKITTPEPSGILLGSFVQENGVTIYPCNGSVKIGANNAVSFVIKNIAPSGSGEVCINVSLIAS